MKDFCFRVIEESYIHVQDETSHSAFRKLNDALAKSSKADYVKIELTNEEYGTHYCPRCGKIYPLGEWPKYHICTHCKCRIKAVK